MAHISQAPEHVFILTVTIWSFHKHSVTFPFEILFCFWFWNLMMKNSKLKPLMGTSTIKSHRLLCEILPFEQQWNIWVISWSDFWQLDGNIFLQSEMFLPRFEHLVTSVFSDPCRLAGNTQCHKCVLIIDITGLPVHTAQVYLDSSPPMNRAKEVLFTCACFCTKQG